MTGRAATDEDDDAALVGRCRSGDGAAWSALVRRYQRLVYAVALRIGHDEHAAADVFQTVFSRLVEQLHRIDEPQRLQAWIVTTAKREALRQRQLARRNVSMTRDEDHGDEGDEWDVADDALLPEQALDALQQAAELRRALEQLDERCRMLLTLVFRDDDQALAYDEVARRMAMPVGSVGPTRARCLDKLRRRVAGG